MVAMGHSAPARAQRELVAVADAAVGMFVVELDRPWIETPFLMQGFLIQDEATLDDLRSLCRFIYIDRTRSIGEHYAEGGDDDIASTVGQSVGRRPIQFAETARNDQQPGFLEVLSLVRKGRVDAATAQRLAGEANADRPETHSVERELLRATPTFAHAENVFEQILTDVRENRRPDIEEVAGCVDSMMQSVKRNPDAMLWLIRLKRYDRSSYHHALDVTVHMMVFARHLGFSDEGTTVMGVAGMMQDIGKLRLPERVLKKAGRLSRLEMEIAKAHVEFSTRIIEESGTRLPGLLEIVSRHHERIDGSGYPAGLAGERIGLRGEMAGVVDSFCAMTSKRAYDEPLSTQRALESLIRQRDAKFSAAVVDAFIQCIGLYPAGTLVELNTGEIAVVISQNRVRRLLPRVLVLLAPDKMPNLHPPVLDLLYGPTTPEGETYRVVRALPSGAFDLDPTEFYLS